jgi:DNA-binding response OmpR family regulator
MSEPIIVIVDDDSTQLSSLQRVLLGKARVSQFTNAEQMLLSDDLSNAHLIILDWELPGMTGLEALRVIRTKRSTPVLFLTSADSEARVVAALNAGADDYLVKPFRAGELLARIQGLLRRYQVQNRKAVPEIKGLPSGLELNQAALTVQMPSQKAVKLSSKEFSLALLFFQNVGCALSREEIVRVVWGRGHDIPSRTLDTHVSRLRSHLSLRPDRGWQLSPVYSFGYRLDVRDEEMPATT